MKKDKKQAGLFIGAITILILLIGVALVFLFGSSTETRISGNMAYVSTDALVCESGARGDAFFRNDGAQVEYNKIKVLFTDNHPEQLSYYYFGRFDSEAAADSHEASFHSKYNKYLSENNFPQVKLVTTFAHVDNEVRIDIYGEVDEMTRAIGVFFFVAKDGVTSFKGYNSSEMKNYYEENGFSCIISN